MTDIPVPNTPEAVAFLERFFGSEPVILSAISEGMPPESHTFYLPKDKDALINWIDKRQGKNNIYFMVNSCMKDLFNHDKAKKELVKEARWLHADIDQRVGEELDSEKQRAIRLTNEAKQRPTVVIDSGGGIQAFWKLTPPYDVQGDATKIEFVESRNRKLMFDYSADHCFNIDRIMRLPGTINIPNEKKRKKGRVEVTAKLLEFNDLEYDINDFGVHGTGPSTAAAPTVNTPTGIAPVVVPTDVPDHVELDNLKGIEDLVKYVIIHGKHPTDLNRWSSRSETLFWVIGQLLMNGIPDNTVLSIISDRSYAISESVLETKKPLVYAVRQVTRARQKFGLDQKPVIEVRIDNLEEVLNKAEAAVNMAGIEIFQMLGMLVRIIPRGNTLFPSAPVIGEVKAKWLLEKFITTAKWMKRVGKELKSFEPKVSYAEHYIEREGEWHVPHLTGIVSTPTLRADFSLLDEPGYDKQSGLFYIPGDTKFPPIPTNPSRDEALVALDTLIEPIRCFPFLPDDPPENWTPDPEEGLKPSAARSVVLSGFLTGIIRKSLITAPLHGMDATTAGSGKSMLADCISLLVTGEPAVMISMGNDEAEDRKRMFSILAAGISVIVLDNISRALEGDALCTILTQPKWQDRILGKSKMEAVSTNALFIATGNNLFFRKDMSRRVVSARIDARQEKPDQRKFPFDPRDFIRSNRPQLVVASLTIILAYLAAGRPCKDKIIPMGSFEQWGVIREALIWLDQPDPAATRKTVQEDDPARSQMLDIMDLWWKVFRDAEQSLANVYATLQDSSITDMSQIYLRNSFNSMSQGRPSINTMKNWFMRNSGQFVKGRRFVRIDGGYIKLESTVDELPPEPEWKG